MSTRTGRKQIFVMGRDGLGLKQITTSGTITRPTGRSSPGGKGSSVCASESASVAVLTGIVVTSLALGACAPKKPPVARPLPPPPPTTPEAPPPPAPPAPIAEKAGRHGPAHRGRPMASRTARRTQPDSPMRVAYFDYDSAELSAEARAAPRRQRGDPEEVHRPGPSPSRATAMSAAPAEYNSPSASAGPSRRSRTSWRWRPREPREDRELRKEFPFEPGTRRGRLGQEPARALRHHRKVESGLKSEATP